MSLAPPLARPDLPATARIALRPLAEAMDQLLHLPALHGLPPFDGGTAADAAAGLAAVADGAGDDIAAYALVDTGGAVCGWTSLVAIDRRHRHAALGPAWHIGEGGDVRLGCHAVHLLLRLAFETLGLVRVEALVAPRDREAHRLLDRLGFVREGIRRAGRWTADGRLHDVAPWSVVATQWPATARIQAAFLDEQDSPWQGRLPSIMPP
ncbi:MAG: GNAT family protein [Pseudomonadota bacterium]|jgi:RimJ/RimL family protein N-acetyltransferase